MSNKPTFMSVITAAKYVGLSTRHFRRRADNVGLRPITIKQNRNLRAKVFFLTADLEEMVRQGAFKMRLAPQKAKAL